MPEPAPHQPEVPSSTFPSKLRRIREIRRHPANRGRFARQMLIAAWAQLANRLLGRPVPVPLGERSRVLANVRYPASMAVAYSNPPDSVEWAIWRRHLQPGDVFVDIGANVGIYSLLAAERGAQVISVEADAGAADQIERSARLNGYEIELHRLAVADRVGELVFTEGRDTLNAIALDGPGRRIECTTLDSIVGDRQVAGLKIDVEGSERLVLEGAQRALERGIELIQIEWNAMSEITLGESRQPVADLLADAGYEIGRLDAAGTLVPCDPARYRADVFAWPQGRRHDGVG